MMSAFLRYLVAAAFVANLLIEAAPRTRRDDRVEAYCAKHAAHYRKYCGGDAANLDRATFFKLTKFCPAYEKHCSDSKLANPPALPDATAAGLVVPPPLPKGGDFAALDLPIGSQSKQVPSSPADKKKLTAAIIATCTPDCTAAHCTDECKCANTHPRVHAMCNPPATSELANTCQQWYSKCPMFQPVQYY